MKRGVPVQEVRVQRRDWRHSIARGSRQSIVLLLGTVGLLHLSPLVSPGPLLALYLIGWVVASRRGVGRAFMVTAVLSLIAAGALWIGGNVIPPPPGGILEELLPLAPYTVVPMVILVPLIFAWEWWASSSISGRVLFTPLVAFLVLGTMWTQAGFRTILLGHPWQYALLSVVLVLLLTVHQIALPVEELLPGRSLTRASSGAGPRRGGAVRSGAAWGRAFRRVLPGILLVLLLILGAYRSWQDQAVAAGGGLLRPTLFRFDFADFINLEGEIQLSRDLVMLYREDQPPPDRLLRRYVLSGYSPRRGFFRLDADREPSPAPPLSVREAIARSRDVPGGPNAITQEYYTVNFDPDAFIAVPEPVDVRARPQPTRSSFNSAWSVLSHRGDTSAEALGAIPWPDPLPPEWRQVYVDSAVPEPVAALAREITQHVTGYYDTVHALEQFLLDEYYYSLVPGDAPDGDQLSHFLFESRKGYCSYFAFAMALMARSLGIPARVAAGFFVVPEAGMLGFHPIRGDMAHAWVEVYFPGVGWVEFDPTAQTPAPGEIFATDYQIDREQLAALVEEILTAPSVEGAPGQPDADPSPLTRTASSVLDLARRYPWFLPGAVFVLAIILRRRRWQNVCTRDPARAAVILFLQFRRALAATGIDLPGAAPFAETPDPLGGAGLLAARARFGPRFTDAHLRELVKLLRTARQHRRRELQDTRRYGVLLLLVMRTALTPAIPRRRKSRTLTVLLAALALLVAPGSPGTPGRSGPPATSGTAGPPGAFRGPPSVHAEARTPEAPTPDARSPDAQTPDALEEGIRRAITAENYEEALRRIGEARGLHPGESRFPVMEGDLYYSQELFQPALRAYREALALGASEYSTRYILARTLARLNRDEEASAQLEKLLVAWPHDTYVVGDLAWLYFKRHRLRDALALLEETLRAVGNERDLLMTLATVRAALFDYPAALEAYRTAIEEAQREDNRFFQAVAFYNLSILQANFFRWEEALESAERSLTAAERSSGYMIRAELNYRRLDLNAARSDYERADQLDRETPLPGLSLAVHQIIAGHPDRAIQRMERIVARENTNWMYSYGTDPDRYQLRVYSILAESWAAGARRDTLFRPGSLIERIRIRVRSLYRHGVAWYYRGMMRSQARLVARDLQLQGRMLPAARQLITVTESFPLLARRHAAVAEDLEVQFNPDSALDYRLLSAIQEKDRQALQELVTLLDDPWRRIDRLEALRELYRLEGSRTTRGLTAAAQLYADAPGSFLVEGLAVPVSLEIERAGDTAPDLSRRGAGRVLRRLGFRIVSGSPLTLVLQVGEGEVSYRMQAGASGTVLRGGTVRGGTDRGGADMVRALEEIALALTSG